MFGMPQLGITIVRPLPVKPAGIAHEIPWSFRWIRTIHDHSSATRKHSCSAFKNFTVPFRDGRVFGQLLGDSIRDSINTLLLIGGFITMFSVILRILSILGITTMLNGILMVVLSPFAFAEIISAMTSGF